MTTISNILVTPLCVLKHNTIIIIAISILLNIATQTYLLLLKDEGAVQAQRFHTTDSWHASFEEKSSAGRIVRSGLIDTLSRSQRPIDEPTWMDRAITEWVEQNKGHGISIFPFASQSIGFPFKCFQGIVLSSDGSYSDVLFSQTYTIQRSSGAWIYDDNAQIVPFFDGDLIGWLPIGVLISGILYNSLFYFLTVCFIIYLYLVARCWQRNQRNCCLFCGYPKGLDLLCPECGTRDYPVKQCEGTI